MGKLKDSLKRMFKDKKNRKIRRGLRFGKHGRIWKRSWKITD